VRIVIVPDKFKGSLPAPAVADAMARGARAARPEAEIVARPLADGGEGTVEALVSAVGGRIEHVTVTGPLGEPVEASFAALNDGRFALEVSAGSGLALINENDAMRATSRGAGELIRAVLERHSAASILVGLGGSASTDGGTGAASALGWRFLDARGRDLPPGGGPLTSLARIDSDGVARSLLRADITGVHDVDNPLTGARGSARVFAPQKGASPSEVEVLEEGLENLAGRVRADLGLDVAQVPGAGAAGGIGAGLVAFFDASLGSGFDVVAEATGLQALIETSDLVITGEGKLDDQSLGGKTPVGVARLALEAGVPCVVVAGEVSIEAKEAASAGFAATASLVDRVGAGRALRDTSAAISEATAALVRGLA
jgi:glycerate 2-kinase